MVGASRVGVFIHAEAFTSTRRREELVESLLYPVALFGILAPANGMECAEEWDARDYACLAGALTCSQSERSEYETCDQLLEKVLDFQSRVVVLHRRSTPFS